GYLPAEASRFGSPEAMLFLFSLFQIALALWLFSGRGLRAASLLSAVALLAIILPNLGVMDLIFRDIGLFFAALALFSLSK
ncbi:MAG: hypothetical protein Q8P39_02590, partial [Candidatus Yanofskybacteria bacterium]|nr:hypothetical protein [Candidatus Yanofskybacteria bacterium]